MTLTTSLDRRELATAVGNAEALLDALGVIQAEGWEGPTGRAVLDYARTVVVGRAVRSAGFTGPEAEYAEATGWAAAWEAMTSRRIRSADSPWGFVAAAVRSAVLNERMEETYGTDARSAWRVHRFKEAQRAEVRNRRNGWTSVADPAALARPLSLTALIDVGYEPAAGTGRTSTSSQWRLPIITDLLVHHGWQRELATAAVLHVCDHARQNPKGYPKAHGWREMALELALPPWQARRVTVLLVGTESWPGLMERLDVGGQAALAGPAIAAAVRATVDDAMRPPARAALTIDARTARQPALAS